MKRTAQWLIGSVIGFAGLAICIWTVWAWGNGSIDTETMIIQFIVGLFVGFAGIAWGSEGRHPATQKRAKTESSAPEGGNNAQD